VCRRVWAGSTAPSTAQRKTSPNCPVSPGLSLRQTKQVVGNPFARKCVWRQRKKISREKLHWEDLGSWRSGADKGGIGVRNQVSHVLGKVGTKHYRTSTHYQKLQYREVTRLLTPFRQPGTRN
jgi:hypothetical protein